jgi:NAD(P)-dependent dehydrogenase (short-subunit alcohol dehydrogenase family)
MKVLAKELAPHNIRVNTVHPTTVATEVILNEPTYKLFRPDLENPQGGLRGGGAHAQQASGRCA